VNGGVQWGCLVIANSPRILLSTRGKDVDNNDVLQVQAIKYERLCMAIKGML